MAYACLQNKIPLIAWVLYLVAMFWTISYDTIYAMADIVDDKRLKIKSSALLFGENALSWIVFFEALMILGLIYTGYTLKAQFIYYIIVGFCIVLLVSQFIVLKNTLKNTQLI